MIHKHAPEAVQADNNPRPLRGHPRQAPARLTRLAWRAHDLSQRSLRRVQGRADPALERAPTSLISYCSNPGKETDMKPRLHAFALAALAVFLIAGPAAAQGAPPAGEPGQHTRVFRSLEDPGVSS